jgi:diadenosine tetraphosphate (Ap4A) HIT family hydrolase
MPETIFDKVMRGEIESYPVWEDGLFFAFLTPFPNTPGLTIVIPKQNTGDYVFEMDDERYAQFMLATKKVANLLEKALGVKRVALVFEGTGVAHVHAKLYPLYGELASQTDVWAGQKEFVEQYRGYITTLEGPQMSAERLTQIQNKIKNYQAS